MNRFVAAFLAIPAPWVVGAVFLLPALETALVLGALLPGEVTVVLGGAIAGRGRVALWAVIVAGIAGPIAGDICGYILGRRYGEELVRKRLKGRWQRAHRWLSQGTGGITIFAGRFVPFLRSVLPMTAGAVRVPAARFLPWDVAAAIIWGAASALLGYFAARDLERILGSMHRVTIAVAILLAVFAAIWLLRRANGKKGGRVHGSVGNRGGSKRKERKRKER